MSYFLLILLFAIPALAELDKIQIKNLDLNYVYPQGSGVVEKVSVGVTLVEQQNYPIEVYRREHAFDVLSPFVDFQWLNPIPFVHNMQTIMTDKLNLKIDRGEHFLRGETLRLTAEKTGELVLARYDVVCTGPSEAVDPADRLKTDCLEKMEASISQMELPFEFLTQIAAQLPEVSTDTDLPANDFALSVSKGDFYSHLRIKYGVRAYLKIWGHAQIENEGKTLAFRMDTIKFGILPVTALVMNELRRQIHHPKVTIDPPWIRIQIGNK